MTLIHNIKKALIGKSGEISDLDRSSSSTSGKSNDDRTVAGQVLHQQVIEDADRRVDTERRDLIIVRNAKSEQDSDRRDTSSGLDQAVIWNPVRATERHNGDWVVARNEPHATQLTFAQADHVDASHSSFVQGNQTNVFSNTTTTTNTYVITEDKRSKIRQWLHPTVSRASFEEALEKRLETTGRWFITGPHFSSWKTQPDSLLWIRGKPGSGKTILSSSIIEDVSCQCNRQNHQAYGYFFFDARDSQKGSQLHEDLLRSLIWQFSECSDGFPQVLNDLYDEWSPSARSPSLKSLQGTLLRILDGFRHAYVIVDALDECVNRSNVLKWIKEMTCWRVGKLHLLATSRDEQDIAAILEPLAPVSIQLAGESVDRDIALYLEQEIEEMTAWKGNAHTCDKVKKSLLDGAHGMFRWVALQLDELRRCSSPYEVEKQLRNLPNDLYESYDRIIQRIANERRQSDAQKVLRWLAFSIYPLSLNELAVVVAVDFESNDLPRFDPEQQPFQPEHVLQVCGGFISLTEGFVKLAHFSVKEYLLSSHVLESSPSFHIIEVDSHSHISQTCLAYLAHIGACDDDAGSNDARNDNTPPLAPYAAEHWISHAESGNIDSAPTLQKLAALLFENSQTFVKWIQIWDIDEPWDRREGNPKPLPLHYAAMAGFTTVMQILLDSGMDINVQGAKYCHVLQAASQQGQEAMVKFLLGRGADVNAQGGKYGNALQAASFRGSESIVKLLIDSGADVNAQGGWFGNALQAASYQGSESIVKLLIDSGADVNAQGGKYGNPLRAATSSWHQSKSIVKQLIDSGADVNAQGGEYGNALQAASYRRSKSIVKLLIDNGADVNAQGGEYGNALHAASYPGSDSIVKLLVDSGADVNAQGGKYGNALRAAASSWHQSESIVKLLIDSGADVNAQDGEYGNALQAAACSLHRPESIVRLLIDNGADVNAQGGVYGNTVQAASYQGSKSIVKLLVDNGADVNAQGGKYGNALQAASYSGTDSIVQLLIDSGADVNAQGGEYGNGLQAASYRGSESIVKLLIGSGADVNAQGGKYGNALHAASYQGSDSIVKLLIDSGADVNAQGGKYGNALWAAASSWHQSESIVRLLIGSGADIHAQGGEYGNALQAASYRRSESIVKLLIDSGAYVNAQGGRFGNALQAASYRGSESIVKLLIDSGADVNAQGGEYGNALQAALDEGSESIVKLLVDSGADVTALDEAYAHRLSSQ